MTHLSSSLKPQRSRGFSKLIHAYECAQVELRGHHSMERLLHLHAFGNDFSSRQCLAILIVTALPCLACITLVDLIPLNPPSEGLASSHIFWLRAFLVVNLQSFTVLEQMRRFVSRLPWSMAFLCTLSVLLSTVSVFVVIVASYYIGFPFPFTFVSGSPFWLTLFCIIAAVKWGKLIRSSAPLRKQLLDYVLVVLVQYGLTIIYPAYNFVFIQLDGWGQSAFAAVLPVLKLTVKNLLSAAIGNAFEDLKPEAVIFNAEVFHALFVACCMQSSTSWVTTVILMVFDFVHAWSSVYDINKHLRIIKTLEAKWQQVENTGQPPAATSPVSPVAMPSIMETTIYYVQNETNPIRPDIRIKRNSGQIRRGPAATQSAIAPFTAAPPYSIMNLASLKPIVNASVRARLELLSAEERAEYVASTLKVLHITEFVLLVEYVEVVVPVLYCVYLVVMFHLPNRVFYPQLCNVDTRSLLSTIRNVLVYAALEFVSFISLSLTLRRKLRLSSIHQLAFVLHSQSALVQAKLILWVVFAVQTTLVHFGYDYTFQFAWLRQ